MSLTTRVLIALIAGLGLGLAVAAAGTPWLTRTADVIAPLGTLFINAIRMTVIPLVVGSLVAGVATVPDPGTLGRLGLRAVVFFLATLAAAALFSAIIAAPLLSALPFDAAAAQSLRASAATPPAGTAPLPGFAQWLVELIPTNPVKAAADGAMLPLIVFSLAFGLALTRLAAESRGAVVRFFETLRDTALRLVQWVLAVAPIGVFALALALGARLGASAAGALAAYVGLVVALSVTFGLLVLYPLAALLGGISVLDFARAILPAQAVAFSSRSSLASLPAMIEIARTRLRLPEEMPSFLLPLAASVYRVGAGIGLTCGVIFLSRLYGVSLAPTQLASVALTVLLTSFSVPGIPGGSVIIMTPALLAAGLSAEGVGILLAVDTIPDMFRTTLNVTGHMAAAVGLSGRRRAEVAGVVGATPYPERVR